MFSINIPRGFTDHPLSRKVKASRILSLKDISRSVTRLGPKFGNYPMRRIYETVKFTLCKLLAKIMSVLSTYTPFRFLICFTLYPHSTGKSEHSPILFVFTL